MTTWRSSLGALLILMGCAEGSGPSFLAGTLNTRTAPPVTEMDMAQGAVKLRAPEGYCIDMSASSPRFAALARCDTLGGTAPVLDRPLALITVALTAAAPEQPTLVALDTDQILERRNSDLVDLIRVDGAPLDDGFDPIHWRGIGQAGAFSVGLAIYAPEGGRATGESGASLLTGIMSGLQTAAVDVANTPPPQENQPRNSIGGWISGLLN